jgi:hypothetical protein
MGCDTDNLYNGHVVLYSPVDNWQPRYGPITPPAGESASDNAEQVASKA